MSMTDDVDKLFEPTTMGWMSLQRQKWRSTSTKEDPEFLAKYKQMKAIRDNLKHIEKCMTAWQKEMKGLYKAAKKLGKAVETEDSVMREAMSSGDMLEKSNTALEKVREKISMINGVLDQRAKLKYIKLKGDFAAYKLEKIRKTQATESNEKDNQKYLTIQKESVRQRDHIKAQVIAAINNCVERTNELGVSTLVHPQLQEFKLTQYNMFLTCQKLIQGRTPDNELEELEHHWKEVKERIGNAIPDEAAGGSIGGSARYLSEKLGGAEVMRKISDFSDDENEEGGDELKDKKLTTPASEKKFPTPKKESIEKTQRKSAEKKEPSKLDKIFEKEDSTVLSDDEEVKKLNVEEAKANDDRRVSILDDETVPPVVEVKPNVNKVSILEDDDDDVDLDGIDLGDDEYDEEDMKDITDVDVAPVKEEKKKSLDKEAKKKSMEKKVEQAIKEVNKKEGKPAGPDDFEDSDFDGEDLGELSDEDEEKKGGKEVAPSQE